VGLHLWYEAVRASGVDPPIKAPGGEFDDCSQPSPTGYGVFLTDYDLGQRAQLIGAAIHGLQFNGFPAPVSFCAGYSATDAATQALLGGLKFRASLAAQPIAPGDPDGYPACWHQQLAWSGHISPLTIPYRVNADSILPPPHTGDNYLDLVEVPLNLWVDTFQLMLNGTPVSREDMFDRHVAFAKSTGQDTAVAIGVHADEVANESFATGRIGTLLGSFLCHVLQAAADKDVDIVYSTVGEVAAAFHDNTTVGDIG
jgi:hypothetical protein